MGFVYIRRIYTFLSIFYREGGDWSAGVPLCILGVNKPGIGVFPM